MTVINWQHGVVVDCLCGEVMMAPRRVLQLGILNIQIHPHPTEKYVELFRCLYALGEPLPVRGAEWGTIGYIKLVRGKPSGPSGKGDVKRVRGAFYRYLNIDPKKPWFDLIERRPLDTEAGDELPSIPNHLKPNFRDVSFLFYPQAHRLFFDLRNATHLFVQNLMEKMCKNPRIVAEFGPVDIIVESSSEVIARILEIPRLTKLEILLTRSNPDDVSDAMREIDRRMENQRLDTWNQNMTSKQEKGIKPDTETQGSMEFALSHGRVNAVGYDGEKRIVESTKPHPEIRRESFNPDIEPESEVMKRIAEEFLDILGRRGK